VGDNLNHNIDVFRIASQRADVVVSTGGLGPTRDDLTREAMAGASGRPLQLDEGSLRHIESMFSARGREMPERNRVQAMFPLGSEPIHNPQGTAPGVRLLFERGDGTASEAIALPGVPAEMKQMFDDSVVPAILQRSGGRRFIRHSVMKFFGTGESDMESRLGEMIQRGRQPRVGITVSSATISLRITATEESLTACDQTIRQTREEILQRVGDLHFGDGETFEQQHAVERQLRAAEQSLMVVELGHAALLGHWFAELGSTSAYLGGLSFADQSDLIRLQQSTSLREALTRIRQRYQADWVLLVDAYPDLPVSSDKPIPATDVQFGLLDATDRMRQHGISLGGHPSIIHARIAKAAMHWFRNTLEPTSTPVS
ncbi:MAG: molybdopterin-binding protein, partial [Planctomycetota bacterium]